MDIRTWPPEIAVVAPPAVLQSALRISCGLLLAVVCFIVATHNRFDPTGTGDSHHVDMAVFTMLTSAMALGAAALAAVASAALLVVGWVFRLWTLQPMTRWVAAVAVGVLLSVYGANH